MGINNCSLCLDKQQRIDELKDEIDRLKRALGRQQKKEKEGFFGSSTPSSKLPVKTNVREKERKPRGGKPGHNGSGRKGHEGAEADRVVEVEAESELCPECGNRLEKKGIEERSVLDTPSTKPEKVLFRLSKRYCPHCRKSYTPQPPGVLPKSLYGNQLIANAITMYYLFGLPMGRICEYTGVGAGSLMEVFHRCGRIFERIPHKLIEEYRKAPVRHADETSWRTDGRNGYAWLFATPKLSIFQFGKNRSSSVPHAVFGNDPLPGVLVVDRYAAYNKAPCRIQYCYAHLLRDAQDLEKEFPEEAEVLTFVAVVAPLLALAMGLRGQPITDEEFYKEASKLKSEIKTAMNQPAKHLGIRRIQDIFKDNESRLYLWAENRAIPADNNLAERDLRPSVVARKVSFGSVTDNGARTRSILTSLVTTIKKRGDDVADRIKNTLDQLSQNMEQDPYNLLFSNPGP
jgi:transposase